MVAFASLALSVIVSGMVSDLVSMTLSGLVSVLFLVAKLLNSSCADTIGVSSVSEGGEVVTPVEKGVGDSFKTRMLCALSV